MPGACEPVKVINSFSKGHHRASVGLKLINGAAQSSLKARGPCSAC